MRSSLLAVPFRCDERKFRSYCTPYVKWISILIKCNLFLCNVKNICSLHRWVKIVIFHFHINLHTDSIRIIRYCSGNNFVIWKLRQPKKKLKSSRLGKCRYDVIDFIAIQIGCGLIVVSTFPRLPFFDADESIVSLHCCYSTGSDYVFVCWNLSQAHKTNAFWLTTRW